MLLRKWGIVDGSEIAKGSAIAVDLFVGIWIFDWIPMNYMMKMVLLSGKDGLLDLLHREQAVRRVCVFVFQVVPKLFL